MFPDSMREFFMANQNALWLLVVVLDLSLVLVLYRWLGKTGLYAVVVLDIMLCNLMGPKITTVWGLNTTMGAILYSGIYFATDLLGERYGKREANRAVMAGFAASLCTVALTQLSLLFQPAAAPPNAAAIAGPAHDAQLALFGMTPRFVLGSLLAYLVSQTHDVWAYHWIKDRTGGKHLWLRNNGSTIMSQFWDTLIYALVVWWGVVDLPTALSLGASKYFFKVLIALIDTPFIYLAARWDTRPLDWADGPQPQESPA